MEKKIILKSRSVGATTQNLDFKNQDKLKGQTADIVVVDEAQDFHTGHDVNSLVLPNDKPSAKVSRVKMFSLNRYLVKKAQARLAKATARQARREAKIAKK